ncbi:MAG: hypothetical protein GF317_04915 [Candidatus Lokiarchaeota archaeon]|nr:hypothetical protein [Candidatus Lokiarchaeota archaeon]
MAKNKSKKKSKEQEVTEEMLEQAQFKLEEFYTGKSDPFYTAIFEACMSANKKQLEQLREGFPVEVAVYNRYVKAETPGLHKPVGSRSAKEELLGGK